MEVIVRMLGGPVRTWDAPTDAPPGFRIVCWKDGHGQPMRPVVYELVGEPHPRLGRVARYAGHAKDEDLLQFIARDRE